MFSENCRARKSIERTTHSMTDEQTEEFYRLLFEEGGVAARQYRDQFAVTRTITSTTT